MFGQQAQAYIIGKWGANPVFSRFKCQVDS